MVCGIYSLSLHEVNELHMAITSLKHWRPPSLCNFFQTVSNIKRQNEICIIMKFIIAKLSTNYILSDYIKQ